MLLDMLVLGIPVGIVDLILSRTLGTAHYVIVGIQTETVKSLQGWGLAALWLGNLALNGLYFSVLNGLGSGQTAGNHAPGIAVRDVETGEAIGLARGVLRWFIRIVLYATLVLPGLLNDLFPLWDARHQSIADKAARSVVIRLN